MEKRALLPGMKPVIKGVYKIGITDEKPILKLECAIWKQRLRKRLLG